MITLPPNLSIPCSLQIPSTPTALGIFVERSKMKALTLRIASCVSAPGVMLKPCHFQTIGRKFVHRPTCMSQQNDGEFAWGTFAFAVP